MSRACWSTTINVFFAGARRAICRGRGHLQSGLHRSRHQQVKVLLRQNIETKEFDDWSMAILMAKKIQPNLQVIEYMSQLGERTKGDTRAHRVLRRFQQGNWHEKIAAQNAGNVA